MARVAVLAGLAAFVLLTGSLTFDQPRPRGSEIAREQAAAVGCPRETLARLGAFEAWLDELPLGAWLQALAARELMGSCSS